MTNKQNSYYQRLNELILDEEKIVTTSSIANELEISLKEAQTLLNDYIKNSQVTKSENLHSTYLLCGTLKNGKGVAVYLIKEESLDDKKCLFENISTEIIYSIQKAKRIDFNVIASVDASCTNNYGRLTTKNCVKRTFKSKTGVSQAESSSKSKETEGLVKTNTQESGKNNVQTSQKHQKVKQNGISSFFTKAAAKKQDSDNNSKPEAVKNDVSKKENSQAAEKISNCKSQDDVNQSFNDEKMDVDSQDKKSETKKKSEMEEKSSKNNTKKRKKTNKTTGPNKKRKRIQEICDSDSSDIFEEENEDIIEKSDEEPMEIPVEKPTLPPKNKVRKAVDKTFVDEEGFMVTTTEYVYESLSEDEGKAAKSQEKVLSEKQNEKISKAPIGKSGKNKKKTVNSKQPTLMNFFSRKN